MATKSTPPRYRLYDAAGNLRYDGKHYFSYDGSNRLRDVYLRGWDTSGNPVQGYKLAHFDYNGLGQLIKSTYNTDGDNSLDDEDVEWTPRDPLGRPIGIWRQGPLSAGARPCSKPYQLFGYHSTGLRGTGYDASGGILDCPAVRWRDTDGDESFDETLFYLQDLRGDITGLGKDTKFGLLERVRYGPTGRPEVFPAADVDFDGTVTEADKDAFEASLKAFGNSPPDYDPRADLNHDGVVDSTDEEAFLASYDKWAKYAGNWKLSQGDGLTPGSNPDGLDNRFGWRGYWYDAHLQKYHVRNRVYDPREGRWMQNDPLGFAAGDTDLYRYCNGEYSTGYDPYGLWSFMRLIWTGDANASDQVYDAALNAAASTIPGYVVATADAVDTPTGRRVLGGLQVVGGTIAVVGGVLTSPTGVGIVVVAIGADMIQSGARQTWTGEWTPSLLAQGVDALAGAAGVHPDDRPLVTGVVTAVVQATAVQIGGAAIVEAAAGEGATGVGSGCTPSPIQASNLARQLTSEEQLAQAQAGNGTPLIGAGTTRVLDAAPRLARQYGGNASDWAKMGGDSSAGRGVQMPGGGYFEIHWYQNLKTGQVVEVKTKIGGH